MQDRFKYRVWDKQNECYAYSDNSDVDILYIETDGTLTYGIWNEDYEDMFYTPESEVIVEQCTGLKDKNGKLIYEGDIVKDTIIECGVIQWNEYHACFMVVFGDGDNREFGEWDTRDFEVIGNIHENADLLEQK